MSDANKPTAEPRYQKLSADDKAALAGPEGEETDTDIESQDDTDTESGEFPKATGGGWFELSNGDKIQGQEQAEEAESKL